MPVSPQAQVTVFGNRLLDAMPHDDMARLSPYMRRIFLHRGQELHLADDRLELMHFPVDALLWCWCDSTKTERATSIVTVGRRGIVGLHHILDLPRPAVHTVVLSPGAAWRLSASAFDTVADSGSGAFRRMILRYSYANVVVSCARLACNSEHNVDKRLARWLLWIMDETGKPEVALTHQQLADVAAIRRPSVSLAFSDLQRRGIVRVHHGLVQILDRERLLRETCACYYTIHDAIESVTASS
ncbi:MAG TPA: Crp/Fnr family transcriptional regulator [Candidatus Baltobacteraceae bacterium]|nr:Crp/Fnr family transcriptional regulator [Candidatus Baltobacteraceae bacterium]